MVKIKSIQENHEKRTGEFTLTSKPVMQAVIPASWGGWQEGSCLPGRWSKFKASLGYLVKPSHIKQKGGWGTRIQFCGKDWLDVGRVSGSAGKEGCVYHTDIVVRAQRQAIAPVTPALRAEVTSLSQITLSYRESFSKTGVANVVMA